MRPVIGITAYAEEAVTWGVWTLPASVVPETVSDPSAPVPYGPRGTRHSGLYGPMFAIPAATRNVEAAWELVKFAASPEQIADVAARHVPRAMQTLTR